MNTNEATEKKVVKLVPEEWVASGRKLIIGIERAKENLAAERGLELPEHLFQVALNEAEALAWETEFPQLVFPELAAEKVEALAAWHSLGQSLNSNYALAI
jgi:hypothetical protein